MTDITERQFYNDLDDAAADFWAIIDPATDAHAPGFDEWNALARCRKGSGWAASLSICGT